MTDIVSRKRRSEMMAGIRGRNTRPELIVRSTLHRLGFRFRLHSRALPGRPDVVLSRHKIAVFVHGCFWHRHSNCRFAYEPKTNRAFWAEKFRRNVVRDRAVVRELRKSGWAVLVVWECQTRNPPRLSEKLLRLLNCHRAKGRGSSARAHL